MLQFPQILLKDMQSNHHQQCILFCMKVHCLYPASPLLSCRKERHFAACLVACGGIATAFIVVPRHHVLNSHLVPVNHEKTLQPLLWLLSANYIQREIQSRPPDMQQCYQQNTFGSYSPLAFTVQEIERIFPLAAAPAGVQTRLEGMKQEKHRLSKAVSK